MGKHQSLKRLKTHLNLFGIMRLLLTWREQVQKTLRSNSWTGKELGRMNQWVKFFCQWELQWTEAQQAASGLLWNNANLAKFKYQQSSREQRQEMLSVKV